MISNWYLQILPVLIQSLAPENKADSALYQSTLTTLTLLVKETPDSIADYSSSLLPLLLTIATSAPSMVNPI
jgi:recombinational DNA repair protein (RecF pathway)